jgi:hypothetical protein
VTGDPNPFPKLKFWSDVTFLEFQKFMKDSNQALDSLKAVWHRMIINPDTRELAARLTGVKEGTDVPDWPGKDFKPGSDEFASLIGSDNGKSVVYLLLQHRSQLGAKTVTNARVWKDHSLHVVYGIDDSCAGGDTDAPQTPSRFRRLDEPDSQKVNDARDAGRFLIMAQDSSADILESCLGIPQSEFNEPKQLGESGWTKLSDYSGAVEEDRDAATFNSWLDMNLDLSENSNHQIEYQHLDKTTGSDGIVYYPSGAYYKNLYNEGGIAALDNASPWKSGRDRDPPVDGRARSFPPLKQWSDAVFLTYKDFCKGDLVKMKKLKGCLRHNVVNTGAKEVLHEYMDKHGDLQDNKPKPGPEPSTSLMLTMASTSRWACLMARAWHTCLPRIVKVLDGRRSTRSASSALNGMAHTTFCTTSGTTRTLPRGGTLHTSLRPSAESLLLCVTSRYASLEMANRMTRSETLKS